uniref:ATP synthase complex subunit 8 n=1 Tax=Galeopterus variegatus TaxID=482537 RepID=Q8HHA3_GALVR|nr:ATPase subunit 8 [Galeopterus variegatus]
MPQLDTSTWFTSIMFMILTLFIVFQLKLLKFNYYLNPMEKPVKLLKPKSPWEKKWTKIYFTPSQLPH